VRAPKPTYANVTASLALFIALGGTSYAVTQLPRNSVGNRELKSNAVTSAKIRDGAVGAADIAANARGGPRGPRGAQGPSGEPGTPGAAGVPGPSETIQVRPDGTVQIPNASRSPATLASITLAPGTWLIDGRATVVHDGSPSFYDCVLKTTGGKVLGIQTAQVGNVAPGALGIPVAIQAASDFAVTTQLLFTCESSTPTTGDARGYYISLLSTHVGRVENR
jgi:hypothetical protein